MYSNRAPEIIPQQQQEQRSSQSQQNHHFQQNRVSTNSRQQNEARNAYELYPSMGSTVKPAAHLTTVCGCRKSNIYFTIYIVFYVVFLVVASIIFMAIESPVEEQTKIEAFRMKKKFLEDSKCIEDINDLDHFIADIITAYQNGVVPIENTTDSNWSFGQALFFTATVVTTIGYGHVTPVSEAGKVFCVVLATLGIPLTLILLTACVERLMTPTTCFLDFLISRLGHLYSPLSIRVLHFSVIIAIVICFFLLIPAAIFAVLEPGWNYFDSLYYCIISLTTIGLGDYVPGDQHLQPYRFIYKICTTGYLLVGLSAMMVMLTVFYDIPELNFGMLFLTINDEVTNDEEKMPLHNDYVSIRGLDDDERPGTERRPTNYTRQISLPIPPRIRSRSFGNDRSSPRDSRPSSLRTNYMISRYN
ncbi:hypothetical protein CHUAL_010974 [Chamberlinius hualienensis]